MAKTKRAAARKPAPAKDEDAKQEELPQVSLQQVSEALNQLDQRVLELLRCAQSTLPTMTQAMGQELGGRIRTLAIYLEQQR